MTLHGTLQIGYMVPYKLQTYKVTNGNRIKDRMRYNPVAYWH